MAVRRRALRAQPAGSTRRSSSAATRRTGSAATPRPGGRIRYLAGAGLDHRRTAADSTLTALAAAAYGHGTRRSPLRRAQGHRARAAPGAAHARRLRLAHAQAPPLRVRDRDRGARRRAAPRGAARAAAGPARRADARRRLPLRHQRPGVGHPADDRRSSQTRSTTRTRSRSFSPGGCDAPLPAAAAPARAGARDRAHRRAEPARRRPRRARALAPRGPLRQRRRRTSRGKFENLNALLRENPPNDADWLLVVDDDVALPADFLDAFVFLAERFRLQIAQPAHRQRSHAAWQVTRRRRGASPARPRSSRSDP